MCTELRMLYFKRFQLLYSFTLFDHPSSSTVRNQNSSRSHTILQIEASRGDEIGILFINTICHGSEVPIKIHLIHQRI